jgi:LPS export ABC transporter protein LptC
MAGGRAGGREGGTRRYHFPPSRDRQGVLQGPPARFGFAALLLTAAACADQGAKPPSGTAEADTADQVLIGMSHHIVEDGLRKIVVDADTAYIYEASHLTDLRVVTVIFFTAEGDTSSVVTADRGQYRMQAGTMQATGHVVARTPDGHVLHTEAMNYDRATNTISSNVPFVYDKGNDHLEGNGFTTDPAFTRVITQQPRGGEKGKPQGGGIPLPGQ